ncbi:MAG TPA: hypothetical protein VHU80_19980, partial [Polyangiaceae bacterium]|nr:hypothetical protein [Polyangiaceae bacterium]
LDLERANASLARLAGAGNANASASAREKMAAALARDDAPQATWVLVLGAGFALFATGLVSLVTAGVSREGVVSRRGITLSMVLAVAGILLWTLAVYRA